MKKIHAQTLITVTCCIGVTILASMDKDGWGWLVVVALFVVAG